MLELLRRICILSGLAIMVVPLPSLWAQTRTPECTAELKKGLSLAKEGQRTTAREHLSRAYSLCKEPVALFNIGMTYREDKEAENAIKYLTQFLKEAPANHPMRSVAEKVILELSEQPEPEHPSKSEPDTDISRLQGQVDGLDVESTANTERQTSTPPDSSLGGRQLGGLVLGGSGIVAMAVGIYFGFQASSITKDIESISGAWEPSDTNRYHKGEDAQRNMFIGTGVGAAALVAGGLLYYLGSDDANESQRMTLIPDIGSSTVLLTAGGSF